MFDSRLGTEETFKILRYDLLDFKLGTDETFKILRYDLLDFQLKNQVRIESGGVFDEVNIDNEDRRWIEVNIKSFISRVYHPLSRQIRADPQNCLQNLDKESCTHI